MGRNLYMSGYVPGGRSIKLDLCEVGSDVLNHSHLNKIHVVSLI